MEEGLLKNTGKTLEEWIALVKQQKLEKHGDILKYLKGEHGMTHGFANFVSLKARASDAGSFDDQDLLTMQYAKGKEELKPVYDKLVEEISKFGADLEFVPKKANVSVRRKKQFALIQPSTKTRIDLGLKLPGHELTDRLLDSGSFGTMCSHRVQLSHVEEVDDEVINWLKEAYESAG
jgi:predicted transport protein